MILVIDKSTNDIYSLKNGEVKVLNLKKNVCFWGSFRLSPDWKASHVLYFILFYFIFFLIFYCMSFLFYFFWKFWFFNFLIFLISFKQILTNQSNYFLSTWASRVLLNWQFDDVNEWWKTFLFVHIGHSQNSLISTASCQNIVYEICIANTHVSMKYFCHIPKSV